MQSQLQKVPSDVDISSRILLEDSFDFYHSGSFSSLKARRHCAGDSNGVGVLSLSGVVVVVVADVASQTMPASTLDPALDESTRQSQTANVCVLVK